MTKFLPSLPALWQDAYVAQKPLVVRGGSEDIELFKIAKEGNLLLYLDALHGDAPVQACQTQPSSCGRMGYSAGQWADWSSRWCEFSTFRQDLELECARDTGHAMYMQSAPMRSVFPKLLPKIPSWMANAPHSRSKIELWIGSGGQRVAIHEDASHSIMCLVSGRKRVRLFPPEQMKNLYLGGVKKLGQEPWRARPDPECPDYEQYPLFKAAMEASTVFDLQAGDMLFIPAHWWHSVDSFELNLMFNLRWFDLSGPNAQAINTALARTVLLARQLEGEELHRFHKSVSEVLNGDFVAKAGAFVAKTDDEIQSHVGPAQAKYLLAPNLQMKMLGGKVQVSGAAGRVVLEAAFAPLLSYFETPSTLADVYARLEQDYCIDHEQVSEVLQVLIGKGALLAIPSSLADVEGLCALLSETCSGVPVTHQEFLCNAIDTLVFSTSADLYPGILQGKQGLFAPKPSGKDLVALCYAATLSPLVETSNEAPMWLEADLVLNTDAVLEPGLGNVQMTLYGKSTVWSWEQVELLLAFASQRSSKAAIAELCLAHAMARVEILRLIDRAFSASLLVAMPSTLPCQSETEMIAH